MSDGYQRRPEEGFAFAQWCVNIRPLVTIVVSCLLIITNCLWIAEMQISRRLRAEVAEKQSHMLQWSEHYQTLRAENAELRNPPLTPDQQAAQEIEKEITWQSWHMPVDVQSELIDQPTLAFGIVGASAGQHFADPHDDPEWHHTRREFANEHCCCMVRGCMDDPKGDAIHHGIAANACVKAGHYELAVKPGPGQKFYRLCEKHHAEIGHGIGHGGNWTKFNVDIESDVKAGRWNSRGKSEWKFMDESELIDWVKEQLEPMPIPEQVTGPTMIDEPNEAVK